MQWRQKNAYFFKNIPKQIKFADKLQMPIVIFLLEWQPILHLSRYRALVRNTLAYTCTSVRTHTTEDTVSQVKVMDMKNVLISSLYNTISLQTLFWKMQCMCVYVSVCTCICGDNELIAPSKLCAESQGSN